MKNKNHVDATFVVLLIGSTCFGHYYAHHQELATMMLITTLFVSFLVCCMLEVRFSLAGVVPGLQAHARLMKIAYFMAQINCLLKITILLLKFLITTHFHSPSLCRFSLSLFLPHYL